jgi:dienelactone hydrolase
VLIVHGATDLQVPAEDAPRLGAALEETGNRDVTVRVIPDVDHVLLADRSGDWRRYVALPSLIAPAFARGLIADWLVTRLGLPVLPRPGKDCPHHP